MSYQELLKQVGITTVAVATATVAVYVGRDQWEKYQAKNSPPLPPPPPVSPYGGPSGPPTTSPQKKLPTGGSLENSPCSDQTTAFLNCAFHNSADLLKCAQLAEGLKACRKLYKLEPEGGSWLPWKS